LFKIKLLGKEQIPAEELKKTRIPGITSRKITKGIWKEPTRQNLRRNGYAKQGIMTK
jgi:hypothetical protein